MRRRGTGLLEWKIQAIFAVRKDVFTTIQMIEILHSVRVNTSMNFLGEMAVER
jgi:hypothetical protein